MMEPQTQIQTQNQTSHHNLSTIEAIANDRAVRQAVTRESHLMFFSVYLAHYLKYPVAEFQKDIFRVTEDTTNKLACIVAFRGSGKSTLVTLSYSLWAILGVQKKKFVLIICQTQAQARQHMANLRRELENNPLLKSDLGPFREEEGEWAMSSVVFQNTGARIMVASIDQSVRGVRHYEHRPDLLILDDVEDMNSTKTMEGRQKTFDWFTREIIPLGDVGTRVVIVGNLLHEDCLVMRLKKKIEAKDLKGFFACYPLLDDEGRCLWPGKFDTEEKVEELHRSVANELAWQQEYLLTIVSDSARVVFPEWIQYYDELPTGLDYRGTVVGVDLAISKNDTADYTAMVGLKRYGYASDLRLCVIGNPFHDRAGFPEVVRQVRDLDKVLTTREGRPKFIVESNGFQEIYVQRVSDIGCEVHGVKNTGDKRSRLALAGQLIQSGAVRFPRQGCEDLIAELTGFGVERHDDLADAFSIAVIHVLENLEDDRSWEAWVRMCERNGGSAFI